MFRSYLKLAWRVLWRRKFFTIISLFGISFTLTVLMVATAVLDHIFAPLAPEVRQERTLLVIRSRMTGERMSSSSMPGYLLLDRYARGLPGVERMAVFSMPRMVYSYHGGQRIRSLIKRTDAEYWRVLDFAFLEGGPFTDQDVANASFVAVINATTRDRFFGGAPALGKTLEADGLRFRVIGVVPDVPILRLVANGDIYAPITTAKTDAYRRELMGGFGGLLLARSRADFPAIQAELETRLSGAALPGKQWKRLVSPAESFFDSIAGTFFGGRNESRSHPERLWALLLGAAFLFSLLPAVNLVNLNMSRIMERASEIGVRKAFGASSRTLVGQFVVENLVLTLVGGAAGFVLSAVALEALNASGLIPYAQFTLNLRVFVYGLLLAMFFGLLSGVYPAWRMSRLHPVHALKGSVAMIRHLLKLVWNRKRSNTLIAIEILLSFIVFTAVMTAVVFYVDNYGKPLGFDVDRIWTISMEMNEEGRSSITVQSSGEATPPPADAEAQRRRERLARVGQLLLAIRDMPEVEAVAGAAITPYSGNTWNSDIEVGGKHFRYGASAGTDEFARTMGLHITRGRWFSREDDAASWRPVVINERLAREMFPGKDPVGEFISETRPGEAAPDPADRMRVVGVITDFRKDGEYAAAENFLFTRSRLDDSRSEVEAVRELVIRVKPGTPADFEERAVARLRNAAPDWTFQAEPLPQSRETALRFWLAPLAAAAVVSLFLLVMVAMGLSGVLWLHVTQRTREIGLRRAKGATAAGIRRQLVGEVAVLTAIATAIGMAIVVQFPILEVFGAVSPFVYGVSLVISLVCIFLLTMACAWTPARMASGVHPAEALRYE